LFRFPSWRSSWDTGAALRPRSQNMNSAELNLVVIGLLCLVGFVVVAVETRLHKRTLLKNRGDATHSEAARPHFFRR